MLARFSLYGFLKNQKYYEPFFLLALLQMGLNFTWIGILIAFRSIVTNIMEIPTGVIADLYGRRKSMIFSFSAYIAAFTLLGIVGKSASTGALSPPELIPALLIALTFFSAGEAFRTGTHKAMIFSWLRNQQKEKERTRVYGYTRSWSKIGSAVSTLFACVFVLITGNYVTVFFFSIVPYVFNIINFLGYPGSVETRSEPTRNIREVVRHLRESASICFMRRRVRRLIFESMGFEGFFAAAKDYLQPVLLGCSLPVAAILFSEATLTDEQKSIVLIGPVYFLLFLLSAWGSRKSHWLVDWKGNEDGATHFLWKLICGVLITMAVCAFLGADWGIIVGFIALYFIQNLWRPILVSRFDSHGDEAKGATILSVESQSKGAATAVFAPLLGCLLDMTQGRLDWGSPFWPVPILGLCVCIWFVLVPPSAQDAKTNS